MDRNGIRNGHGGEEKPPAPVATETSAERRRVPRLNLSTELFRLDPTGRVFSVEDLSLDGMGLRVLEKADFAAFAVGAEISGVLCVQREKYPVRAQVRRLSLSAAGCAFLELGAIARGAIERLLDPARLGAELRLLPGGERGVQQYFGPGGTELLVWRSLDGDFRKFILFVLGSFVLWSEEDGLKTGAFSAGSPTGEARGVIRFDSVSFREEPRPDRGKLGIAIQVVMSSNLSEGTKSWIERRIKEASREGP